MATQIIKNHTYEVINANAAGAVYSRAEPSGIVNFQQPAGTTLYNNNVVDRLLCNDDIVAFDYYGNLGAVYRLYRAAFARTPDKPGLASNVALFDDGTVPNLQAMAAAFLVSAEAIALYGNVSPSTTANAAFYTALYFNVLGRDPESGAVAAWVATGYNRAQALIGFSESPENHAAVDPTVHAGVLLTRSYFGV